MRACGHILQGRCVKGVEAEPRERICFGRIIDLAKVNRRENEWGS